MNRIVHSYYRLAEKVMNFAYLNLLWILFTLLGLGVFGLMPATAAMFAVVRKWTNHEEDIKIFQTFWKSYKKNFFQVNFLGLLLFLIGYVLSIELHILRSSSHTVYYVASYGVWALLVFYSIILLYFFPIYVHFDLSYFSYFKWPFVIGIIHPILTITMAVVLGLFLYILYSLSSILLLLFGGSVSAYILQKGASLVFPKYEQT